MLFYLHSRCSGTVQKQGDVLGILTTQRSEIEILCLQFKEFRHRAHDLSEIHGKYITNKKSFFDILAPKHAWNEQGVDEKYFFPTSHRIYCIQQKQCKN